MNSFSLRALSILFIACSISSPMHANALPKAEIKQTTAEEVLAAIPEQDNFLKREEFKWYFGDRTLEVGGKVRYDLFAGKNINLLNSNNYTDETLIPGRVTFDLNTIYTSGKKKYGREVIKAKTTIRTKQTFGNPESVASTGDTTIKHLESVLGSHSHAITRPILWARELWIETCLNDILGFTATSAHKFMVGFFPFQLGRGIALGDAYTVDPDVLGYYSPNAVDQYAPGFKFSGGLIEKGTLDYDIYFAILNNKASSFTDANMKILGQQYGHLYNQARGPGVINWIAATRLIWRPCNQKDRKISFEPYVLYDSQKEQRVEFVGDASGQLGTVGLAIEAQLGRSDWGMEFAQNFGGQSVKGWDRNIIKEEITSQGVNVFTNSEVVAIADNAPTGDTTGKNARYNKVNQVIVDNSPRNEDQNGQVILAVDGTPSNLRNSAKRYTNPYTNKYRGFMFVADGTYTFCEDVLKMSVALGIASGDDNPNRDIEELGDSNIDGDFNGFISLQELYTGKRVKSAFYMSGSGKVPRPLSFPSTNLDDQFSGSVSRFTNLVFGGWGATIEAGNWKINPNILSYWQQYPSRRFDLAAQRSDAVAPRANPWLGLEFNLFADWMLFDDIRVFIVTSAFVPGTYYSQIKGRPITKDQQRYIDQFDKTGFGGDYTPTLGDDPAYTLNVGFEYKF